MYYYMEKSTFDEAVFIIFELKEKSFYDLYD